MLDKSLEPLALLLIDHLVRLSTLRDRDALLKGLTQALAETVEAHSVTAISLVLDEDQRYWMPLTACRAQGVVEVVTDPLRADVRSMLPMEADGLRLRCAESLGMVTAAPQAAADLWRTVFPVVLSEDNAVWGVVELESRLQLSARDTVSVSRLLQVFCNMLDVLDYSECDALTGLWNRKSFEDLFFKTMPTQDAPLPAGVVTEHRAPLTHPVFWLAMVDIDHFKQVNDVFGHLIGDEVLILVARLMRACFRSHDRVFRFGGEEFVVVLRCADHASAQAALERFRATMEAYDFPQVGQKTASVGFTRITLGDSPSAACERADQAVYHAKRNGRNQVCSESDLVDRGLLSTDVKVGDIELF
ncbi:MAG: GGDEF domain-containing protein [Burkholderiales bacterium PBB4]|nr:MAG: GGDEF domain-containing protein [Burkholderiales bacterium PBB4]